MQIVQASPMFEKVVNTAYNALGAVLTAAHCFSNASRQRYILINVEVFVGAYDNPPYGIWYHLVQLRGGIDYNIPEGYLRSDIDYIKWDIAMLTLPPENAVPLWAVPAFAYPRLGKPFFIQAAADT